MISCKVYLFGIWEVLHAAWDAYPQGMTDAEWRGYYRKWMNRPWRWVCHYKLLKKVAK